MGQNGGRQRTEITYKGNCPDYIGNQQGVRVEEATTAGGVTTTKSYLIDQANFTGYAQMLEEYVNGQLAKTFTLGHDVITQADATSGPLTLIYDGHGSTRAMLDAAASVIQRYAYGAYGQMLTGQGLTTLSAALTSLLYSGEMTDKLTGLQNLRDRLYDARTGRFTQSDRYAGRNADPASLHKYVYTHANPINGIDPSGQDITALGTLVNTSIRGVLQSLFLPTLTFKAFATRVVFGLASFTYNQVRMNHYEAPLAQAVERLASVVQPISPIWGDRFSDVARRIAERIEGNTILSFATSFFIPHFAGSHVNVVTTGTMGAAAYLQHLDAEAAAMAFIKEWSGLDIKIDVNALDAGAKYLALQLDPARDVELLADAILAARRGDMSTSQRKVGSLLRSLVEQYGVSLSGSYHGRRVDVSWELDV